MGIPVALRSRKGTSIRKRLGIDSWGKREEKRSTNTDPIWRRSFNGQAKRAGVVRFQRTLVGGFDHECPFVLGDWLARCVQQRKQQGELQDRLVTEVLDLTGNTMSVLAAGEERTEGG